MDKNNTEKKTDDLSSYYWAEKHENKRTKYLTQEARKLQRKPKESKRKKLIQRGRELINYKLLELINEYKISFFGKTNKIRQTSVKDNLEIKNWTEIQGMRKYEWESLFKHGKNLGKCRPNIQKCYTGSDQPEHVQVLLSLRLPLWESSWG